MKPIQLDFKPSMILTVIICAAGIGAAAILILLALDWHIKLVLAIGILAAVVYTLFRYALLLLPWSCITLKVSSTNELLLVHKNGRQLQAQVLNDSVVTPYLTVVNCRVQESSLLMRLLAATLVIVPDMLDTESYRQLRVWLRWGQSAAHKQHSHPHTSS